MQSEDFSSHLLDSMRNYKRKMRIAAEREAIKSSKNQAKIEVYADMVKVSVERQGKQIGGGTRTECRGFSTNSRRRLQARMAQWNLNGLYCSFVTLTYPAVYSTDWRVWKRDLESFLKRIERKYPHIIGCAWRVEFQKRGAPHYHLLIASKQEFCTCHGVERRIVQGEKKWTHKRDCAIHAFRSEIASIWPEVVRVGYITSGGDAEAYRCHYERNRRAGTGVESMENRRQVVSYVSKYMGKLDGHGVDMVEWKRGMRILQDMQERAKDKASHVAIAAMIEQHRSLVASNEWGRTWGFRNLNGELDFSPVETINLSYSNAVNLKRLIKRWLRSRGKTRYAGMLDMRVSYSILGLGTESDNGCAIYTMLKVATATGLLEPHITPRRFLERVNLGLVGGRKPLAIGSQVNVVTIGMRGKVENISYCNILKRYRCSVRLDDWHNGTRYAYADLSKVCAVGSTQLRMAI